MPLHWKLFGGFESTNILFRPRTLLSHLVEEVDSGLEMGVQETNSGMAEIVSARIGETNAKDREIVFNKQ